MDDIYEILDRAYESEDDDEVAELVERALALDPDNPEALLLKADIVEDEEEKLSLLEKALAVVRLYFAEEEISGDDVLEDEMGPVYLGLLQRAAYLFFFMERDDDALSMAEEFLRYECENRENVKDLYYCILLDREEWSRVLEETMKDVERTLGWAYARMIATFMLSKDKKNANVGKMLWDAVRMAPNVPFYMMGYIPDPVDESEAESDDYHFSVLFENIWSISRELLNWFSSATILFGLLSRRFGREKDDMREILDALGGGADYEDLSRRLPDDADDRTILAALAEGGYPKTKTGSHRA
ncbi:MAG: hypothetical protein LBT65_02620 [Synergistaceae bacterium]|jgi:tetratricopeptide (TPR) repeat protein|nr:hypothetical protein [Synergistaceae bacterium]